MSEKKVVTYEDLEELLKDDNKVKVGGIDVDGVIRGKYVSKKKFMSSAKPNADFGFCSVIFGWDINDVPYPNELAISNRANGYRDISASIDLSTYRRLPWENNVPLFLVSFSDPTTGAPLSACARSILDRIVTKFENGPLGVQCLAGSELEYFQFSETPQSIAAKGHVNLNPLTPGMHGYSMLRTTMNKDYFLELFDAAEAFGIEVEGHHTETGPGVYETALAYTQARRMADNTVLYKLLAKSIGIKYGIMPTFMAKPWADLPGCSGHIHVSLKDPKSGKNIFAVSEEEVKNGGREGAKYKDTKYLSQVGEYFLAGIMTGLPDVMPLLCPTINSYKRIAGGEAFWAPNICSYGYDSRAASVRILGPPGSPDYATRFEVRVPGADMNAPLAFAAIFALGHYGIEKKLELPYGPIGAPGVTKESLPKLPTSLETATDRFMAKDSLARVVLGDATVDHIGGTRLAEVDAFKQTVTDWEKSRYMELV